MTATPTDAILYKEEKEDAVSLRRTHGVRSRRIMQASPCMVLPHDAEARLAGKPSELRRCFLGLARRYGPAAPPIQSLPSGFSYPDHHHKSPPSSFLITSSMRGPANHRRWPSTPVRTYASPRGTDVPLTTPGTGRSAPPLARAALRLSTGTRSWLVTPFRPAAATARKKANAVVWARSSRSPRRTCPLPFASPCRATVTAVDGFFATKAATSIASAAVSHSKMTPFFVTRIAMMGGYAITLLGVTQVANDTIVPDE